MKISVTPLYGHLHHMQPRSAFLLRGKTGENFSANDKVQFFIKHVVQDECVPFKTFQ